MKSNILFILLIGMLMTFCLRSKGQQKEVVTTISGHILEESNKNHEITVIIPTPENFKIPAMRFKVTTNEGRFLLKIPITIPRYLQIKIDDKPIVDKYPVFPMFIENGDSLVFEFKDLANRRIGDFECSGKGSDKISYLKESFLSGLEFNKQNWDDSQADSLQWRVNFNLRSAEAKIKILENYEFVLSPVMKDILKAYIVNDKFAILLENIVKKMSPNKPDLFILASRLIENKWRIAERNPRVFTAIGGYTALYLQTVALANYLISEHIEVNRNYFLSKDQFEYYSIIKKFYADLPCRNFILASFIDRNIKRVGFTEEMSKCANDFLSDKHQQDDFYKQIKTITLAEKQTEYKPIPMFTLKGVDGNTISLNRFLGKVVVIDFWFTGCTYCREIKPHFEKIEKTFKGNAGVVFVSISIDRNMETWLKKGIGNFSSATALQLYTNGQGADHPIVQYLNFNGYPAIYVIDTNGIIVSKKSSSSHNLKTEEGRKRFIDLIRKTLSPKL
jgi:thiol-disulfide isomerase/thioredoxin